MATRDNELYNEWERVAQQMTASDNEWRRVTTSGKEWQRLVRVTISGNFSLFYLSFFFQIREEPTTKHLRENFLNLEEDLWRRPTELKAETSTQEEILTVRNRNCKSRCSQIFIKIRVLKNFAIFTGKILCWSPFLRKLQVLKPTILLKGVFNPGVFLWILRNF